MNVRLPLSLESQAKESAWGTGDGIGVGAYCSKDVGEWPGSVGAALKNTATRPGQNEIVRNPGTIQNRDNRQ